MATRNDEVMEMVRQRLQEKPDVELRELYESAQRIDPEVANLSTRQFYARYPLQIKRRRPGTGGASGAGGGGGSTRKAKAQSEPRRAKRTQSRTQEQEQEQKQEQTAAQPVARRRRRSQRNEAESRDAVRGVFLRFAGEVAQAESRSEVVGVISNVDGYVDEVVRLINRA
ncbi:hypothetical protein BH24GEM3_BH24GEM3_16480 [soil metagenome]